MQLTSQGQSRAMVVEFRPHAILSNKFVYTLKFMGDEQTKSMRLMSKKEMIETVNARLLAFFTRKAAFMNLELRAITDLGHVFETISFRKSKAVELRAIAVACGI